MGLFDKKEFPQEPEEAINLKPGPILVNAVENGEIEKKETSFVVDTNKITVATSYSAEKGEPNKLRLQAAAAIDEDDLVYPFNEENKLAREAVPFTFDFYESESQPSYIAKCFEDIDEYERDLELRCRYFYAENPYRDDDRFLFIISVPSDRFQELWQEAIHCEGMTFWLSVEVYKEKLSWLLGDEGCGQSLLPLPPSGEKGIAYLERIEFFRRKA